MFKDYVFQCIYAPNHKGGKFLKKSSKRTRLFGIINWVENVNWKPLRISQLMFWALSLSMGNGGAETSFVGLHSKLDV